jgi:hypothetical protein
MISTQTKNPLLRAAFAATLAVAVCGCGGMQQARLRDQTQPPPRAAFDGRAIPVLVGNVTASINQPQDLRDAVCRYLRDQTAAAIAQQEAFLLVNTNVPTDLLSGFGITSSPAAGTLVVPEAAFDVEVIRLEEKLGATVKIGVVSSQQKHAVVEVKITLRSLTGGENLTSVQQGKSSKGAWGVITSVYRESMKGEQEEWKLDGSMIGIACADAICAGVEDLQKQTLFRAKTLDAGIEERLLRPRTERGR